MNLLYLSYWGINDGLTHSTVFPYLEIISSLPSIATITLVTIERDGEKASYCGPQSEKILFEPLYSQNIRPGLLNKVNDFLLFPKLLIGICSKNKIDKLLARGAPAGALAWMVCKKLKMPYIVESFEPHSAYMLESGVWSRFNPKYIFEKYWERKQKETAAALIVVSENYRKQLIAEDVHKEKIFHIPCCVDIDKFRYNESARKKYRKKLSLADNSIVGIYVGKFGDIYYKEEAFEILEQAFDFFGDNLHILILTPQDKSEVLKWIRGYNIPKNRICIDKVPHYEIPNYLSASDFALSFVKPASCRKFCSPIKDGEYWANGLITLMANDIGDDSTITQTHQTGFIFNLNPNNLSDCFNSLNTELTTSTRNQIALKISMVAQKTRSYTIAREVYTKLLG